MFGEIRNQVGEKLDYSFAPGAEESRELVLIGHGVTANKDREWAVTLADALESAGIASLRFSFSGNGDSEGDFRASCPTKEAADLRAVLDAIGRGTGDAGETSGPCVITYVGHSMGAAVGVLVASRDLRIRRLISLGGMVDTADFALRKFGSCVPGVDMMWDKPECPLSNDFLNDMESIGSVEALAPSVQVPWLLVHGTDDTVVPPEESERIHRLVGERSTLVLMEGVDHVFSGAASTAMASHVLQWMKKQA